MEAVCEGGQGQGFCFTLPHAVTLIAPHIIVGSNGTLRALESLLTKVYPPLSQMPISISLPTPRPVDYEQLAPDLK